MVQAEAENNNSAIIFFGARASEKVYFPIVRLSWAQNLKLRSTRINEDVAQTLGTLLSGRNCVLAATIVHCN